MAEFEQELLDIGMRPGGLHVHPQAYYRAEIGFLASRRWLEPVHANGYTYWRTTTRGADVLAATRQAKSIAHP